jgi:hypothetical protein
MNKENPKSSEKAKDELKIIGTMDDVLKMSIPEDEKKNETTKDGKDS